MNNFIYQNEPTNNIIFFSFSNSKKYLDKFI